MHLDYISAAPLAFDSDVGTRLVAGDMAFAIHRDDGTATPGWVTDVNLEPGGLSQLQRDARTIFLGEFRQLSELQSPLLPLDSGGNEQIDEQRLFAMEIDGVPVLCMVLDA